MSLQPGSESVPGHPVSGDSQRLSLDLLLKNSLRKCGYKENPTFLPDDQLDIVMTSEHVKHYLSKSRKEQLRAKCSQITEYICGPPGRSSTRGTSRRIFAILLIIGKPIRIMDVMKGGIDDTDLPFYRVDSDREECLLARKSGGRLVPIQSFDAWPYVQRLAFYKDQWRVQAPVFLKAGRKLSRHPIHRFENDVVFPWTYYKNVYDGNSEVNQVKIHTAHCHFDAGENRSFALKRLKTPRSENIDNISEFLLEVKALLKVKQRSHLEVDLLTTFEHDERYHMLFRWADGGNLDDLWRNSEPRPKVTYRWVCWLIQQCAGLAFGLEGVHNTEMTAEDVEVIVLSPVSPTFDQAFAESANTTSAEDDDDGRNYGRHGDIKPQNVLWFKQDHNSFGLGVLKLADFGLTTFHHALTTQVLPNDVRITPTYSAPEREIDEKLSRPFDIWSLGCIFLEFVTWLLLGHKGLDMFSKKRANDGGARDPRISLDNFYIILREEGQTRAEVKPSVKNWITHLKQRRECSEFLSEFLSYIENRMLVVDRRNRDQAGVVSGHLNDMSKRCQDKPSYALYPGATELDDIEPKNKRKRTLDNSSHDGGSGPHRGTQVLAKRTRQGRR